MVSSIDVAKKANVSQSTVSRVLNSPHKVNPDTRKKVLSAIKELNYRPNNIARSLVSKETMTISLISGPLHNQFFSESTTSIVNYANNKGFNVNVHFDDIGDNTAIYQNAFNQQVDGIILSSIFYNDEIYDELTSLNIPFIMFNRKHEKEGNYVEIDNEKAGYIGTECLLQHQHRDIIWIGGSLSISTFHDRHKGYENALKEYRIPIKKENTVITDTTETDVKNKILSIISRKERPTAIFAATDSIAFYVMDLLGKKGIHIPNDISIIGVDNVRFSNHQAIQLSTISTINEQSISQIAIEELIDLIHNKNTVSNVVRKTIDVQVINRGTIQNIKKQPLIK